MTGKLEAICGELLWRIAWALTTLLPMAWFFNTAALPADNPGRVPRFLMMAVVVFGYACLMKWLTLGPIILLFAVRVFSDRAQEIIFLIQ